MLQPQNDPKKCLYLLVAHSSLIEKLKINNLSDHKSKTNASPQSNESFCSANETDDENSINASSEPEIDDEDEETDSSFVILYNISFERCVNIFLNQNKSYFLYEVKRDSISSERNMINE